MARGAKAKAQATDQQVEMDPDEGFVELRSLRRQWFEHVLLCLCNTAWAIDADLLPMFFTEIRETFGVSQTLLGTLVTAKGLTAALFAFPCGFMSELLPRPRLIGLGMIFWASGLTLCGLAWSFELIFCGRILNGIGLGIVQPLLLSLVADKNPPTKRGTAFGSIFFVAAVCNTVFGIFAIKYASTPLAGIPGWRVSVAAVALFSAIVGVMIMLLVIEPNAEHLTERRKKDNFLSVFVRNIPKVKQLFKYPTFVLILCQGGPGTAPWTIFPSFTQWLQLSCFTHSESSWIFSYFGWGKAFSSLVSGVMLNLVARRFPNHGPPTIANFSVASGVPFLLLLFFILPKPQELGMGHKDMVTYSVTFLLFGLVAAMCGTVNKKVFADIVPPAIFTYVFAIDQLIENSVGSLAGLAVGVVTDVAFHYDESSVKSGDCAPTEGRKLGMGMFVVCLVTWGICFTVYLGMHWTYPRDRRRQLELRRVEAEAINDGCKAEDVELAVHTETPSTEVVREQ